MSKSKFFSTLSSTGSALGQGLVAGLAGTIAITASQMIEMQLTNRSSSSAPMKVGGKVLGAEPRQQAELEKKKQGEGDVPQSADALQEKVEANQQKFSQFMHFGYGTAWGIARSVLDKVGVRGLPASLAHFTALWGTAQVVLPANDAAPPITQWPPQQIATDVLHHAVYALAAGAVYDAMQQAEEKKSRFFSPTRFRRPRIGRR